MEFNLSSGQYDHFEMAKESIALTDEPTIILAPNGAGKTTLFNIICKNHDSEVIPATYLSSISPQYKQVEGKTKTIVIDPTPTTYSDIHNKCNSLRATLSMKERIRSYLGITKKGEYPTTGRFWESIRRELSNETDDAGVLKQMAPLSEEQRQKLAPLIAHPNDLKKVMQEWNAITNLDQEQAKTDAWMAAHSDISAAFAMIRLEEHKEEIEREGCPFCGGTGEHTYEDMLRQKEKYAAEKIFYFRDYEFLSKVTNAEEAYNLIDSVLDGLRSLDDKQELTLLFTEGTVENERTIKANIDELSKLSAEEDRLQKERDEKYQTMKDAEPRLNEWLWRSYPGCKLVLDESSKTVTIKMERAPQTYSEGEKHFLYQIIMYLLAVGSSKRIILFDDPLTELDAANEHQMVFSIVQFFTKSGKCPIVFSCNAELVNLATKYAGNTFRLLYMESGKRDNRIEARLTEVRLNESPKFGEPYLVLPNLAVDTPSTIEEKVTTMIAKRAAYDSIKESERSEDQQNFCRSASKIMHYDKPYLEQGVYGLSNDELFSYAESLSNPKTDATFLENARGKITAMLSARVYLEKRLYDYDVARESKGLKPVLSGLNSLFKKINDADKANDWRITEKYPRWNRKELVGLKTMLNDNEHPYGLAYPLHFALSVSWDFLMGEIRRLKQMFAEDDESNNPKQ